MFYDVFAGLCEKHEIKPSKAAEECGINKSNVSSWKNNGYVPRGDALAKIADYFGVTVDYLINGDSKEKAPALTKKDECDISKRLDKTLSDLENSQGALMFDGEPLDDVTKELLIASLKKDLEMGKRIAKQKFTPKKYRKPE